MDWTPPPTPMTWTLPTPVTFENQSYASVTVGCPTASDLLKAADVPGASAVDVTLRLIEAINVERVPYGALREMPAFVVEQIGSYFDMFMGAPLPGPLEAWRKAETARRVAAT